MQLLQGAESEMAKEKLRCQVAEIGTHAWGVGRHPSPSPLLAPAAAEEHAVASGETAAGDQLQDSKGSVQELLEAPAAAQNLSRAAANRPVLLVPFSSQQQEKNIWHKGTLFLPPLTVSLGIHSLLPETEAVNQFISPNTIPTPSTESSNSPGQLLAQRSRAEGRRTPKVKSTLWCNSRVRNGGTTAAAVTISVAF